MAIARYCRIFWKSSVPSTKPMLVPAKSKLLEPFRETYSFKTNLINDQQIGVVIDGGHLMLTIVNWPKQLSFIEIADKCVSFVIKKYSRSCTIVFDCYPSKPTTEKHAHYFRTKKSVIGPKVVRSACSKAL